MKPYAESFYFSPAWRKTREAYLKSVGGLCEICLEKGIYTRADIVHHKEHITPDNIGDENITLDWGNLQAVCKQCHNDIHSRHKRRYRVDEYGRVTT